MEYTEKYELKKPEASDYYNIADFNDNADTIDEKLYTGEQAYDLANQLLERVQALESENSTLKQKARYLVDIYAMSGTKVTLRLSGYSAQEFTIGTSGNTQREVEGTGTLYLSYVYNNLTYGKTVQVTGPGVMQVALAPKLEVSSWSFINTVGQLGLAESCWTVGDTKSLTVDGNSMSVRILDFNYDRLTNGGKGKGARAAMTFGFTDIFADTAAVHSDYSEATEWSERDLFTTYLPAKKNLLPSELKSVIKSVQKPVIKAFAAGDNTQGAYYNAEPYLLKTDLFIFSERELFGEARLSVPYFAHQDSYEYFARGGSYIIGKEYWVRDYCYTQSDGGQRAVTIRDNGMGTTQIVNVAMGVWAGFCV